MELHLDITCDFIAQFSAQTGTPVMNPDRFIVPASLGTGQISAIRLPDQTQVYCFNAAGSAGAGFWQTGQPHGHYPPDSFTPDGQMKYGIAASQYRFQ